MTKAELIEKVSETSGENKASVARVLDGLCGVTETSLKNGEEVTLHGFGKFSVVETAARKGRNPRTGEEIDIPAGRRVVFTAFSGLKDILKG